MPSKGLPSQPGLLQLKHQAKELLRAYLADDIVAVERIRASLTNGASRVRVVPTGCAGGPGAGVRFCKLDEAETACRNPAESQGPQDV